MGVQVLTPNVKPRPWNVDPSKIDPRFSFVWRKPLALFPMFEGGGTKIISLGRNRIVGTIDSGDSWRHDILGGGVDKVAGTARVDCGQIEGLDFRHDNIWTAWAIFQLDDSNRDESAIITKWNAAGLEFQFNMRTDNTAAPTRIDVKMDGNVSRVTGSNGIELNTPYLVVVTNDASASNNLRLWTFDILRGKWIDYNVVGSITTTISGAAVPPIAFGGKSTAGSDDLNGVFYTGGFNRTVWSPGEVKTMAEDVFGWMRPARRRTSVLVPAGGPVTIAIPVGAVTWAGQVPTIDNPVNLPVPVGGVTLDGKVPALDLALAIPVGGVSWDGKVPTLDNPVNLPIPVGGVLVDGFVPLLDEAIPVPAGGVTWDGKVPTLDNPVNLPVPVGGVTWDGKVPIVDTGDSVTIEIPVGGVLWAGEVPNIDNPVIVVIPVGGVSWAGKIPTADNPVTVAIPLGGVTWNGQVPTVSIGADVAVQIPAGGVTWDGKIPTLDNPVAIAIPVGGILWDGLVPVAVTFLFVVDRNSLAAAARDTGLKAGFRGSALAAPRRDTSSDAE